MGYSEASVLYPFVGSGLFTLLRWSWPRAGGYSTRDGPYQTLCAGIAQTS
jgi:hypothetical protein